jgi:hypothetical protein
MPLHIVDANGVKIAKPLANTNMPVEQYRANAQLLVDAANQHAALIARERQLLDALQAIASLPAEVTGPAAQPLTKARTIAAQALAGTLPSEPAEQPFHIVGDTLVIALPNGTMNVNLTTGSLAYMPLPANLGSAA